MLTIAIAKLRTNNLSSKPTSLLSSQLHFFSRFLLWGWDGFVLSQKPVLLVAVRVILSLISIVRSIRPFIRWLTVLLFGRRLPPWLILSSCTNRLPQVAFLVAVSQTLLLSWILHFALSLCVFLLNFIPLSARCPSIFTKNSWFAVARPHYSTHRSRKGVIFGERWQFTVVRAKVNFVLWGISWEKKQSLFVEWEWGLLLKATARWVHHLLSIATGGKERTYSHVILGAQFRVTIRAGDVSCAVCWWWRYRRDSKRVNWRWLTILWGLRFAACFY